MKNYRWDKDLVLELFGTTRTLVPVGVGGTLVLVGWAVGMMPMVVGGAIIAGVGAMLGLAQLVTDGEKIYKSQLARDRQAKFDEDQLELDRVASLIQYDTDKRTREFLKDLRAIKAAFDDQLLNDEVGAFVPGDFRDKFADLFWKSIRKIEKANRLLNTSKGMKNKAGLLAAREQLIDQAGEAVITLTSSFEGLTTIALTQDNDGLDRLRDDLETRLAVTEAVNDELRGIRTIEVDDEYLKD